MLRANKFSFGSPDARTAIADSFSIEPLAQHEYRQHKDICQIEGYTRCERHSVESELVVKIAGEPTAGRHAGPVHEHECWNAPVRLREREHLPYREHVGGDESA